MIEIKDKRECCGCEACAQRCPKQCIEMREDDEGFLYPHVDTDKCIDCGLCERVCPVINQQPEHQPLKVFAAKNSDDAVRMASSSGGIFTAIATQVITQGGVVFGARFAEDWSVEHAYTETIEGLAAFRGSKYVQSRISDTFAQAEQFLKAGRQVLFSGTPCQIAGLKRYLRKDYDNLLAVDIVCHGVPSPGLWRRYLAELYPSQKITAVNFRDKVTGWKGYSCTVATGKATHTCHHDDSLWMRAFLKHLTVRPSCSHCPAKCTHSAADITLGDLWGVSQLCPDLDDDRGLTLVVEHNTTPYSANINSSIELALEDVSRYNPALVRSSAESAVHAKFQSDIQRQPLIKAIKRYTRQPLIPTIRLKLARLYHKILNK